MAEAKPVNEELLKDLRENYPKFKSTFFAKKYNIPWQDVRRHLKRFKLYNEPREMSLEEAKTAFLKDYIDTNNSPRGDVINGCKMTLAKKYRVGIKQADKWLKEEDIKPNKVGSWVKKYRYDEDFFEVLDRPEKAYWLGFIAADGYLNDNKLGISLAVKDKSHLELFSSALGADFHLSPFRNAFMLWISSKKIHDDLIKLGITERKTYTLDDSIFEKVPKQYVNSFCLGYFDGDGCFGYYEYKRLHGKYCSLVFHLIANKSFLERFVEEIGLATGITGWKIKRAEKTKCSYHFYKHLNKENAKKLYDYFYNNNSSKHFLNRKKSKIEKKILSE